MKAVLIDDEYYALQGLKLRLDEVCGIDVVGMFTNGRQALEKITELQPDIVFLDIEMPNISGVDLFPQIKEIAKEAKIVFTTAYAQYAVEAFELNALDYLIKPVEKERILKTLERLKAGKRSVQIHEEKRITINCFRKMSLKVDGKEINYNLRKKSEELLAYLICHNGQFTAKEKIMEALWPEADKEKAANNLYVAFYNLKRPDFGGLADSIESARGKMRIRVEQIKCDVFEFRKMIKQCGIVNSHTIETAENAAELYLGMLFEENYFNWAELEQAELEVMYMDMLEKIIKYYKGENNALKTKHYETKKERI